MTDYYDFHKFIVNLRGREIILVGKPGVWSWDELNPGTAALLEMPRLDPDAAVLDLGCGIGVIGAVAGLLAPRGHVTLVDCNVAAVPCAKRTLAANGVANADVRLGDGVEDLAPASFDAVLTHLPRGREVQKELIRGAGWVLRPGGRFYLVANTHAGVKSAIAYARDLFGRCGVVRRRKGYHVAMAVKPEDLRLPPPGDNYRTQTVTLEGIETTLVSKPGIFAWDRLDKGTELLVEAMEIGAGDRVLDLGCGTGLAGLAAARRAGKGKVVLVDADLRAVEASRRTMKANGIENAEALPSDCASILFDREPFDVVITNPPFHQGIGVDYEVAHQFVYDARRVLAFGGQLSLVGNRFVGYDDLIQEAFGNVDIIDDDGSYHVLTAVKRAPGGV